MDSLKAKNQALLKQYCYLMKKNERLRKKAQRLNQENQALLTGLKKSLAKTAERTASSNGNAVVAGIGAPSPDLNTDPEDKDNGNEKAAPMSKKEIPN